MKSKPLAELARPQNTDELMVNPKLKQKLKKLISDPSKLPHLVLTGPPGTGKTSAARVIANQILGNRTLFNYLELNASSDRGVEKVRTEVHSFVSSLAFARIDAPKTPYKIVLLDEADSMTQDSQNALRNMMETYSDNCRFILSCNNYNRIIDPLKSRTLRLEFTPIPTHLMEQRLIDVARLHQIDVEDHQISSCCTNSEGDFRKAYNSLGYGEPKDNEVNLLAEYLVNGSLNKELTQVYAMIKLKKRVITEQSKELFEEMLRLLVNHTNGFKLVNRLAECQAAVLNGATEIIQLMGWYGYYRS